MQQLPPIPANPGEEKLNGVKAIARFGEGSDSPEACRRVTMLTIEVPPERRIPSIKEGRRRISFKSWVRDYYAQLAGAGTADTPSEPVTVDAVEEPASQVAEAALNATS
jgi:hypothetical protein